MTTDGYLELNEALRENRLDRAEELCRELLAKMPEDVPLLTLAGTLAHRRGELQAALRHFSAAAAAAPAQAELQNNLGVVLEGLGRYQEAVEHYRQALALRPRYCEANCNLGNALRALGRNEDAISCYRAAISINPDYADTYLSLGHVLRAEERWDEAVESYRKLVALQPEHLPGWINLGGSLLALNRFEEAIAAERRAIMIDPASAEAHWNLAHALLATGDFRQGWQEYEWRLKLPGTSFSPSFAGKPMWDGAPLDGRTLLIRAEQGFGDSLQLFRYLPLLVHEGVRVVLECRPELLPLFSAQDVGIDCFPLGEPPPPFDTFAYFMSLPYLLGATLHDIPARVPYLQPDPGSAAAWSRELSGPGVKAGIVWAGSPGFMKDGARSLPLHTLAPLAALPGIRLFSLQVGAPAAELAAEPWGGNVRDLAPEIRTFADTAAIIANLDLVICVDTAVAHLAGAMGKPVFLMLPFASDWRWLHDRPDSPWYPTMRLYRQGRLGDWDSVIAAVVRDLAPEPVDVNRLFREANALRAGGRTTDAIAAYRELISLRPDLAEVHNNLGLAYQDEGRLDEAAECYRHALQLKPELADAYNNLGTVLVSRGDPEGAIPCFRNAIALREDFIPAYINLGASLQYLERPEEAVPLYRRAIALQPDIMEARINLGNAYQEMMQPEQAVAAYEEALRLDPQHPDAHWNLALSLLSLGDFERGWREYEWRLHRAAGTPPSRDGASLDGKKVLLECEQGLGDTLQFVRYAPLVAALGAQVLLQCQYPSLKPLLARVEGVAGVFARGEEVPPVDCRLPLLSLPRIFGTTLERLPATIPYLTPDLGQLAKWSARIGNPSALKVGLVWRGGPIPKNRACPYHEFAPLAELSGVCFHALQLGEAPDQRVLPALDLAPGIADFGDSAGILANLDLLITVDTAAAHLAGGMGVPVWTMLPYACDWRWLPARTGSPWYPTMRIFRQQRRGDWKDVVLRIREELARMARERAAG